MADPVNFSDLLALLGANAVSTDKILIQHLDGGEPSPDKFFTIELGELAEAVGVGVPIDFGNGSTLQSGDPSYGSNAGGGIEQVCVVDYRQRWEGGRQWYYDQGGAGVREVRMNFSAPTADDDDRDSLRFRVGSRWVHEDGRLWICADATEGAAVWNLDNVQPLKRYELKTSSFTAALFGQYIVKASASLDITLPASPTVGDVVTFADGHSTFGTYTVTVLRNGNLIETQTEDIVLNVTRSTTIFLFVGDSVGWKTSVIP